MDKQKGFSAIEAIIILLVLGLIGFGAWWVYQANNKPTSSDSTQTNSQNADLVEYTNTDMGISFMHPKAWGDVVTEAGAPSGMLLTFSNNSSIVFGSYSELQNRSTTIYDFDGYTKEADKYYVTAGSTKDLVTPKAVITAKNSDVLVVDNDSFTTLKTYFDVGILKSTDFNGSDTAGLVNVKTSYKGVVFVNQQKRTSSPTDTTLSTGQVSEAEFERLLATVSVL